MLTLSPETEALIRAKAAMAGTTPDQLIRDALGATSRGRGTAGTTRRRKVPLSEILAIAERSANRPLLDRRPADEIIGYDEHGLPR